ncbi:hypothetical protein BDV32DRAFT_83671 [Aspergillus pseudonomiae]|nr:hypothetical protein BDV32DRAFT_83671 [Aspergillus pseudonomiae]
MASDRDPRREPTRRRQSGASALPQRSRDLYDQVLATRGELPRSQPTLPSPEYANSPRYQGNHSLPFQAPNEQPPVPIQQPSATHPGGNYTLGQGHFMSQPQSAHANISHTGHHLPSLTSHGTGGGQGYIGCLPHPQSVDNVTYALSKATIGPPSPGSPVYTRDNKGYSSANNATSNGQFTHQNIPPPVSSGPTPSEPLDSRYRVQEHPRTFFKVGRVFAVVWHEGMGNAAPLKGGTKSHASDRELITEGKFGAKIFTDIRRMVVFKEQAQCAWCFPVHTYSRLGVAKASVDPSKHAIIYIKGTRPAYGPNEPKMTKDPLEVTPEPYQKLHMMSRLNFGKIYTVEHNQRVLPVGNISEESMAKFHLYAKRETELGY